MTRTAILFDCEFLTAPGAPQRFWCGPDDPDPIVAQIGAVRLALDANAEILDSLEILVKPFGRDGRPVTLHPLFSRLTGVTQQRLDEGAVDLAEALARFDRFSQGAPLWSWGKDEFNLLAISCYVAGIAPPIPVTRFGNAVHLLVQAGVPSEVVVTLRSNTLTRHFGLMAPDRPGHDALGDAQSVAIVLQHLIRGGKLAPEALSDPLHRGHI
ncbi:exonuclease [Maliponia aquimaris]|uniref:Exonuclease domain-containing protein n=1 Tax=Maliponia aquimaris TaxID=1673631 RepID=A0A238KCI5_9RHOB|nr:exonuclease [Maliponia aquimaris]SMX40237.1 hypothetical protein MAA8898_02083 [Maliponia aquimaris]